MTVCFQYNIFCCYLPAHCSHSLQPLDNGVFNAVKAYYRSTIGYWQSLTDSSPVDKINFIKAYRDAREKGFTKETVKNAWRTTGNWPISRRKAVAHPEIQADKEKRRAEADPVSDDEVPKSGRDIMDLAGPNASAGDRLKFRKIGLAFDSKEAELALAKRRILELEAQVERLTSKKRRVVPNPNKKFMSIEDILAQKPEAGNNLNEEVQPAERVEAEIAVAQDEEPEGNSDDEDEPPAEVRTRSGRTLNRPQRYAD
jgi:hypothetical protein